MLRDSFVSFIDTPDDASVELFALTRLDRLQDTAPSDSRVSLVISRYSGKFSAHLRVSASDLSFSVYQTADSPYMAAEKAFNEARGEIQRWRIHREFENSLSSQGGGN